MVPFDKQVVTVIRHGKVGTDTTRCGLAFGISDKTFEGANAATGRTMVPGAGPNPAHYHTATTCAGTSYPAGPS